MFDQFFRSSFVLPTCLTSVLLWTPTTAQALMCAQDPTDPPAEEPMGDAEDASATDEPAADGAPAPAPEDPPPSGKVAATVEQSHQLDMALHYILIGKPELVQSTLTALFDSGITDEQIAALIDQRGLREKVDRALTRGRGLDGAAQIVAEFESRFLAGTRASSRNVLLIEEAVVELGGSMRQEMVARTRLLSAGAFATPALLAALSDSRNPKLANAARSMLVEIKRLAVAPLCAALPELDPSTQRVVCGILAEIGYPSSQAALLDLATNPATTADVRAAAERAYAKLGGTSADASSQYTALARRYFDQTPALIPYARDARNVIWQFDSHHGLVGTEIPTALYCETMAMQAAVRALALDPNSELALSIYVASDLRRSLVIRSLNIDTSDESSAGSLLATRYSAEFFATASGARIAQVALGFALDASDVLLARECIRILAANGGEAALVRPESGRSPVIEALLFADRRVRFEAAVVLANTLPGVSFRQDTLVVPILASMIQTGGMHGAVIASTEEDRQALSTRVSALGVSAVATGGSLSEVEGKMPVGQTLDLVVIQGSRARVNDSIAAVRVSRIAATAPIVVVSSGPDSSPLSIDHESDPRISVFLASATDTQLGAAIESAVGAAGGLSISQDEADQFAATSLNALRRIAEIASPAFDVRHAEPALIAALGSSTGPFKASVASVLARISSATSQRALMDAALAGSGEDQAILLMAVATSARAFGNHLEPHQLASLPTLIGVSSGATADAAGQAFGALGLSNSEVVKLILAP
ncbi:MAG: hypothetical protein EXS01_05315 [Phycisphaerales bacterium]|nr:hypothetical protein [Phycisphaerales bacterium]